MPRRRSTGAWRRARPKSSSICAKRTLVEKAGGRSEPGQGHAVVGDPKELPGLVARRARSAALVAGVEAGERNVCELVKVARSSAFIKTGEMAARLSPDILTLSRQSWEQRIGPRPTEAFVEASPVIKLGCVFEFHVGRGAVETILSKLGWGIVHIRSGLCCFGWRRMLSSRGRPAFSPADRIDMRFRFTSPLQDVLNSPRRTTLIRLVVLAVALSSGIVWGEYAHAQAEVAFIGGDFTCNWEQTSDFRSHSNWKPYAIAQPQLMAGPCHESVPVLQNLQKIMVGKLLYT
jgi:hypothetical protein